MLIKSYKELIVWQKSVSLVVLVYKFTRSLPEDEKYGLTSQIRRSAVSIPANIAEGWGRNYTGEYIQFLSIALGSATELETLLIIADKIGFKSIHDEEIMNYLIEVQKLLNVIIRKLKGKRS